MNRPIRSKIINAAIVLILITSSGLRVGAADKHNPLKPGTDAEFSRLYNMALENYDSGNRKDCEEFLEKSYLRAEEINDDVLKCISLCRIGIIKIENNELNETAEILARIKLISSPPDCSKETIFWRDWLLAEYYSYYGKYSESVILYESSLAGISKIYGRLNRFSIELTLSLAVDYGYNENFEKFNYLTNESIKNASALYNGNHIIIANAYNNLGGAYYQAGDYDKAIACFTKSLLIRREMLGENNLDTAGSYNNLGSAYDFKGDYDRAIEYHIRALRIKQQVVGEKSIYTANSYINIGLSYKNKGDYYSALDYYEKALGIRKTVLGDNHPDTASTYLMIGTIYGRMNDVDKAIGYYNNALKIYKATSGEFSSGAGRCYNNLGFSFDIKKDYKNAIEYYNKALRSFLLIYGEAHPETIIIYSNLGSTYRHSLDYEKAYMYYAKALALNKKTQADQETVIYSGHLGITCIELKNFKEAYTSFLAGIETIEKVRRLNLAGGVNFTSRNIDLYYCSLNACYLDGDMDKMFNISERMRAIGYVDRLTLKAAMDTAGVNAVRGRKLLKLKDDIERLSSMRQKLISVPVSEMDDEQKQERDKQLDENSKLLAKAEAEFNKLDNEFMKNGKYKLLRNTSVVSAKTALGLCGKDGAIVEYIIPDKPDRHMKPYAIVITHSSINAVELDSSYNYSGQIEIYRKHIRESKQSEADRIGFELYGKLFDPINSFINTAGIKKLIIVPDGSLSFLPFDSLKTKDKQYISERYEITLAPSVTVSTMIRNRNYNKQHNLMAFGGGIYSSRGEGVTRGGESYRGVNIDNGDKEKLAARAFNTPLEYYQAQKITWSDLPGTEREVSAINEKIYRKKNTDVYTGLKVSEENLKSLSKTGKLKKYSSIHFACHGYYDPEYPAYSAVVFSEVSGKLKESKEDGYMSVEETALLNLQSEIVVLSACETGLGRMVRGDGVIGLTRAFQVAGSNRVLVTLWQVSDEATEAFMVSFYSKVSSGMSYSEALVKVKEEFRNSAGSGGADYSAPYFWAGFVLYE